MTQDDFREFSAWFDVLAVTHSKSFPNEEIRSRAKSEYFEVLRFYPREAVESSYQSLRRKMKKWPVPADWLEALPPAGSASRLPPLTPEQAAANDEAESCGYERNEFCHCAVCVAADATHLKSRYVPMLDAKDEVIPRRHPLRAGGIPVLLGRWIHGHELKRWYAARGRFWALKAKLEAEDKAAMKSTRSIDQRIDGMTKLAKVKIASDVASRDPNL